MLTPQEIFNKVALHLLTQSKRSVGTTESGGVKCAYRGDKGTKCAVGGLIDDEHYSYLFDREGHPTNVTNLLSNETCDFRGALQKSGVDVDMPLTLVTPSQVAVNDTVKGLLWKLQDLHDASDVPEWANQLHHLANLYKFDNEVVKQFRFDEDQRVYIKKEVEA